ncbi:helix-turn-helix domain-containing protein [Streptococcus henryi]|uniref:helix-turn-helix domain-containing protein n=1 Tax=Streptococcus henryi TaxID=439219 RepID=UPI0003805BCC|nr:helix-turn-helix transcriptional regulator [Streptococcus henryi]
MTFGEKLREARKTAGMTQEQLANMLSVSRQAITKWESDKGIPDVENLKILSKTLGVSIDYLLDENGSLDISVVREPINLEDYANLDATHRRFAREKDKYFDEAVRARFPQAEIHYLLHKQIMTKKEKGVETALWLTTPFANTVEVLQSFQNSDKHFYLVTEGEKQFLVLMTDEFMEIRQLARPIENMATGKKFEIGSFRFTYSVEI